MGLGFVTRALSFSSNDKSMVEQDEVRIKTIGFHVISYFRLLVGLDAPQPA
jgi:hypothetical protein